MTDWIGRLLAGTHPSPHRILGAHRDGPSVRVHALLPGIVRGEAVASSGARTPLHQIRDVLWQADRPGADYWYEVDYGSGPVTLDDPFRFGPRLTDADRDVIRAGGDTIVDMLGSTPSRRDTDSGRSIDGVDFAVWAPNARGVTVFGDFDSWGGQQFPMVRHDGVWELFVPGAQVGDRYKYRIVGADGLLRDKADPLAHRTQCPPETASIVDAVSEYSWRDEEWMTARAHGDPASRPLSIYEVHLGSWRPGLDYRRAAHLLADHVVDLNFTHVQLLPLTEHPYGPSWGYQVGSFFAPTARFGAPDDLRYLVDHLHSRRIGVILDWVPAHFPKDPFALGEFDGTALYEHADPLRRDQPDWGTYAFNLGRDEVRGFLLASARYWCDEFHVDGLRVDAVAAMLYRDYSRGPGQWRPAVDGSHRNEEAVDFLRELTDMVHRRHSGVVVIAEESTAWPGVTAPTSGGGLGFDFKWDLGWMHRTLDYVGTPPAQRGASNPLLLDSLTSAVRERHVLPLSHDEMVHGKGTLTTRMPGAGERRADHVRALLAYQWAHPGKNLLFMGQEFGQIDEWSDHVGVDWPALHRDDGPTHRGIARLVRDLGRIMFASPALYTGDADAAGLEIIDTSDTEHSVVAFLRLDPTGDGALACVFNFSDEDLYEYRTGLPRGGRWREVLNTAALEYRGSGVGNLGSVQAHDRPAHGRGFSADLTLPARSSLWLAPA
ncbi:1,4-alpha-glucan branching protein GlgB [Gordonia sp. (in: high G+C Gram-positive bacteria)]|uniref:1,4-alpha-glucan branching protein GlgB n=1 Tax=Gordonia sp. (in: high G+C Gram-positive bacteria) TaxID=84139 RepID=UPI003F96F344